jgi:hypothetical protein
MDRVFCGRDREAVRTAETRKLDFEQYARTENSAQNCHRAADVASIRDADWWRK